MVTPTTGWAFHYKRKGGWVERGMRCKRFQAGPKPQVGLQKTVPERSVDSERQKSEISIKTSTHNTEGFIKMQGYQNLNLDVMQLLTRKLEQDIEYTHQQCVCMYACVHVCVCACHWSMLV